MLPKRGLAVKIEEWLLAGECILANENSGLMFCERGVRTLDHSDHQGGIPFADCH